MKPGQLQPLCLPPSCFRAWSTSHEYEKKLCLYNDSYTVPPCDIKLMLVLVCFLLRKGLILKKKKYDKVFVPPYKQLTVLLDII